MTLSNKIDWATIQDGSSLVRVNVAKKDDLLSTVRSKMRRGQGYTIATLNLDHIVKMRSHSQFLNAYSRQSLVTADGNPIVWLSRLAGRKIELIPGSEVMMPVAEVAAQEKVPVALYGSSEPSLKKAADELKHRIPDLDIVLAISPPMGFDPEGELARDDIQRIRDSGAKLVILALGAPKQEIFAARAQELLPDTGFLSIGAGLDFISGMQTRAPLWVRKLAMEWLWRMIGNPKRLALRYGACFAILPGLTMDAVKARYAKRAQS